MAVFLCLSVRRVSYKCSFFIISALNQPFLFPLLLYFVLKKLKQSSSLLRLHKIGKNPGMVSTRSTLDSDCRQISDIVAALSAAECDSAQSTWNTSDTPRLYRELQQLSKVLAFPGLRMGLGQC